MSGTSSAPPEETKTLRLQVVLARAGLASRRHAAAVVEAGRVAVNGAIVRDPGRRVDPALDVITVDGAPLGAAEAPHYYALHKPRGVLSAAGDTRGRRTVTDFLPPNAGRCVPVGRLDLDSEGLLLLSNDGPLIDGLLHPSRGLPRTYLVEVEGVPNQAARAALGAGVELEPGVVARASVRRSQRAGRAAGPGQPRTTWLVLTLHAGRKREVRRMLEAVGHPVARLIRVRFGPILLRDMPPGAIRPLTAQEVRLLRRAAGLGPAAPQGPVYSPPMTPPRPDAPQRPLVVAIDGPVASGKTVVGRRVAERLGWPMLDTGIMYRALTWLALERAVPLDDPAALVELANATRMEIGLPLPGSGETSRIVVDGRDATPHLRDAAVETRVSILAAVPGVRERMVALQQEQALRGHLVMVGRDIGTVVAPNATAKVYLDAAPAVRAQRRATEMQDKGQAVDPGAVLRDIRRRDALDAGRATSPLRKDARAVTIDTNGLTLDQVVEAVLRVVRAATEAANPSPAAAAEPDA